MVKLPDLPLTLLDIIDLPSRPLPSVQQPLPSLQVLPSTTSPLPSSSAAIGFNSAKPPQARRPRPYLFSHRHIPVDVEGSRHSRPSGVPQEGRRFHSRASNSQLGPVAKPLGVKPGPAPFNLVFMPVLVDTLDALANIIIFEAAKQFQSYQDRRVGHYITMAIGSRAATSISRRIQKTPDSQIQMKVPDTETYIEAPGARAATEEHLKFVDGVTKQVVGVRDHLQEMDEDRRAVLGFKADGRKNVYTPCHRMDRNAHNLRFPDSSGPSVRTSEGNTGGPLLIIVFRWKVTGPGSWTNYMCVKKSKTCSLVDQWNPRRYYETASVMSFRILRRRLDVFLEISADQRLNVEARDAPSYMPASGVANVY
ncbi:hypothetical protein EDB86DRAFT_2830795 [Lactarius hatsudake]|nr:hypothetical protein EDB86DRAFT_2830795 [Lactarius hatsudake]